MRTQLHDDFAALGRVLDGVVEQVGEHALDHAEVGGHGGQARFDVRHQSLVPGFRGQLEFLENVLHQIGQGEVFLFRLDHAVFQPRQFKHFLREPPDLAALAERDFQIAPAIRFIERIGLEQQGLQIAVQRGERRAQIVGNVGEQLAALLVLQREFAPLLGNAAAHLQERLTELGNLVFALGKAFQRRRIGVERGHALGLETFDGLGEFAQRPRDEPERGDTGQQTEQRHQQHGAHGGVEHVVCGHIGGQRIVLFALQHHVDIAGVVAHHAQGRGAEYFFGAEAAWVITADRQRRTCQQLLNRFERHTLAFQVSVRSSLGDDASVQRQQIELDAGVHVHQLAEQLLHGLLIQAAGLHQLGILGNVGGEALGQALHHLLLVHAARSHL